MKVEAVAARSRGMKKTLNAANTVVNCRVVIREGLLTTVELEPRLERHNRLALQLALNLL